MTTGELINLIGSDGIQEALLNRWLVPDPDTGFLTLNTGGGKLQELESACHCYCGKTDCACAMETEKPLMHTIPLRENFAGFGIPHPAPSAGITVNTPVMPRQQAPQAPTSPAPQSNGAPQIGDSVMVGENGKTFNGVVGTVGQDGRYKISFGNDKPPMDREYSANELRLINKQAA